MVLQPITATLGFLRGRPRAELLVRTLLLVGGVALVLGAVLPWARNAGPLKVYVAGAGSGLAVGGRYTLVAGVAVVALSLVPRRRLAAGLSSVLAAASLWIAGGYGHPYDFLAYYVPWTATPEPLKAVPGAGFALTLLGAILVVVAGVAGLVAPRETRASGATAAGE